MFGFITGAYAIGAGNRTLKLILCANIFWHNNVSMTNR